MSPPQCLFCPFSSHSYIKTSDHIHDEHDIEPPVVIDNRQDDSDNDE